MRQKERAIKKRKEEEKVKMLDKSCDVRARQLKKLRLKDAKLEERQEELEKLATEMKPTVDNNIYLAGQVMHELDLAFKKFAEVKA